MSEQMSNVHGIKCWNCHIVVSLIERDVADGICPHCGVEMDLESYLIDAITERDTMAQRCRELEAASVMPGFLVDPLRDTLRAEVDRLRQHKNDYMDAAEATQRALKSEVADLKARLLEAERGNEELVRLRAERRALIERIQQIVTHPHESKDALAARVRNILEAGACAHTTGDTPEA